LTGGEVYDCPVAERLIRRAKPSKRMRDEKAYDSAKLRDKLGARNQTGHSQPQQPKATVRLQQAALQASLAYRDCFQQNFRCNRYDRLARNYLASVCLAAALVWSI
jgi:hypothetical protein